VIHTLTGVVGTDGGTVSADVATLCVTGKKLVAGDVLTLELASPHGFRLRDWAPGAHIDLVLPNGMTRQYSLCGDRWNPFTYRVGVLHEQSGRGGSAYVHDELEVGDHVGVGGPRNNFALVPSEEYLFVAGGIGITPLLPMVRQAESLGADWRLLYGGRHRLSMAFLDELAGYGERVQVAPQDEFGLLDLPAFLGASRPGVKIYSCGPAPLLDAMERACVDWPPYTLRTERFVGEELGGPVRTAPFEVELARTGTTVTVTGRRCRTTRRRGIGRRSRVRRGLGTDRSVSPAGVP